jgi:hypothetical protein
MRRSLPLVCCLPLALLLTLARPATASEVFPQAVKDAVPGLPCVPQCTLCHQANPGMPPANKPFALKLKEASAVVPKNIPSLVTALQKLQTAGAASDADLDGQGDYLELSTGADPNSAEVGATLCVTSPLYGCGASTLARVPKERSADPTAAVAGVLSILLGLLVMRRRR